ncbi:MAG: hypothetical protein SNJ77_02260 [Cytophagales bacterium]
MKFHLILANFLIVAVLHSQSLLTQANQLYEVGEYEEATPLFEKVFKSDTNNLNVRYKLAICYLYNYYHDRALNHLKYIYKKKPNYNAEILYDLARAEHFNYLFDEAERHYRAYASRNTQDEDIQVAIDELVKQCELGRKLLQKSSSFVIKSLGTAINTPYDEHSPVLSSDGNTLIFASGKPEEKKKTSTKDQPDEIYISYRDSSGNWSIPKKIILPGTGDKAPLQLVENDSKLIYFRYTTKPTVYVAGIKNSTVSQPANRIRKDNGQVTELDAFMTFNGKSMYISTDDDNLNGTSDIFVSNVNKAGVWESFKKLSSKINTDYDEVCPFVTPDGKTLYFSSNGHGTIGGFDIFKCELDTVTGQWKEPVNAGIPLNTPGDDVYFYFSSKNPDKGVFASYRPGGVGERDLYEVINLENTKNVRVKGTITDQNKKIINSDIEVLFYDMKTKALQDRFVYKNNPKQYDVVLTIKSKYEMIVKQKDKIIFKGQFDTPPVQDKTNYYIINDFSINLP